MENRVIEISVAKDFADTPGARYRSDGKFSGEEFRQEILVPKFARAQEEGLTICVDLDGCYGYATSFLEEAFGGLARQFGIKEVQRRIRFISNDEPGLIVEIERYIVEAEKK